MKAIKWVRYVVGQSGGVISPNVQELLSEIEFAWVPKGGGWRGGDPASQK